MPAKRVTLNAVNRAIRALGGAEELVRGNGYFYFVEGTAAIWPSSSVITYALNGTNGDTGQPIDVAWWVREYVELRDAYLTRRGA